MQSLLKEIDILSSLIKQEDHFKQRAQVAHADFQAAIERLLVAKRALENKRSQRIKELSYKIKSIKEQLVAGNTEEASMLSALTAELEALNTGNFMAIDRKQLTAEVNDTLEAFYRAVAAQDLYHSWYHEVSTEEQKLCQILASQEMVNAASVVSRPESIVFELESIVELITGEPAKCNSKDYMRSWALQDTAKRIASQGRKRINEIKASYAG